MVSAAESALRILEHNRIFRETNPLSVATDTSRPTEERLNALRILRATPIAPAAREPIVVLAQDPDTEIAIAALGMFHHLARDPEQAFDQRVLIPALEASIQSPDARIRETAFGALSSIGGHRPAYLTHGEFPALLEAGSVDPDPRVRVVAMVTRLRGSSSSARVALIEQGLADSDPYVRSMAVTWLGLPETDAKTRRELLAQALADPDQAVRATAESTRSEWQQRKRAWPIELWRLWQQGERGKVGMKILTAVTIATPILICGGFLIFFTARFLALLAKRSWRAVTLVPVVAVWTVASYGLFLLYFLAGHAGDADGGEVAVIVAILWGAIGLYTLLGWGLHFVMRG